MNIDTLAQIMIAIDIFLNSMSLCGIDVYLGGLIENNLLEGKKN